MRCFSSSLLILMLLLASGWACCVCSPGLADEMPIENHDREHWAFVPLAKISPAKVVNPAWPAGPIDAFVLRRLEKKGLEPAPTASRAVLLRRVKFDLLGLPPTPRELQDFLSDQHPAAYARLVDRLLSSPAYGERWGQHWLDLARFAETDGFEHDNVRDGAWQYRQWVIDALNRGIGYHEFIRAQLAGDLSDDPIVSIATMFLLAGPDMPDINEQDLRRHDKMNEMTGTLGAVLLGMQMQCAQCHDHKYDPISQADFFRLRAIFEAAVPKLKSNRHVLQLSAQPQAISPYLYHRGELDGRGAAVQPKPPRVACDVDFHQQFGEQDPRSEFVDWLFQPQNPLVARVIANRIWQHHFGTSLCDNPNDLGVITAEPNHPELLDWLAWEMIENDWSIKHLHRQILLSATYRQASFAEAGNELADSHFARALERDPDNRLYSRFPRKRLQGELIRDALLAISGQLDRRYGGPSVLPPLPPELTSTLLKGQWKTSESAADHHRRSIYIFARRNLRYPIFEVFDRPDAGATCAVRGQSTTAIQSLQLLNSQLTLTAAEQLSQTLLTELAHNHNFDANSRPPLRRLESLSERLIRRVYSRPATVQELTELVKLLSSHEDLAGTLQVVCVALLNTNEFIYID
ncbi:DUF1549 and DUF1553 domain-containing protein [Planctomycetaceae bacterium SH139]